MGCMYVELDGLGRLIWLSRPALKTRHDSLLYPLRQGEFVDSGCSACVSTSLT